MGAVDEADVAPAAANPEDWVEVDTLDWGVQVRVRKRLIDGSMQLQVLHDEPKRVESDVRMRAHLWKALTGARPAVSSVKAGDAGMKPSGRPMPWVVVTAGSGGRDGTRQSFNQVRGRSREGGGVELQFVRHEPGQAPRILRQALLTAGAWQVLCEGLRT